MLADLFITPAIVSLIMLVVMVATLIINRTLAKTRVARFVGVLFINVLCCMIPLGTIGVMFGFIPSLVAALLTTLFLDKKARLIGESNE